MFFSSAISSYETQTHSHTQTQTHTHTHTHTHTFSLSSILLNNRTSACECVCALSDASSAKQTVFEFETKEIFSFNSKQTKQQNPDQKFGIKKNSCYKNVVNSNKTKYIALFKLFEKKH